MAMDFFLALCSFTSRLILSWKYTEHPFVRPLCHLVSLYAFHVISSHPISVSFNSFRFASDFQPRFPKLEGSATPHITNSGAITDIRPAHSRSTASLLNVLELEGWFSGFGGLGLGWEIFRVGGDFDDVDFCGAERLVSYQYTSK